MERVAVRRRGTDANAGIDCPRCIRGPAKSLFQHHVGAAVPAMQARVLPGYGVRMAGLIEIRVRESCRVQPKAELRP